MRGFLFGVLMVASVARGFSPSPQNVVVVANAHDPVSREIAHYYIEKRDIPEKNLIELATGRDEIISWDAFNETILHPLREELMEREWLRGEHQQRRDVMGRRMLVNGRHSIDFLVTVRLPVRIADDKQKRSAEGIDPELKHMKTNQAAVDSELALLALNEPATGYVESPFFNQPTDPEAERRYLRVSRLDGPGGAAAVKRMIDAALEGEQKGLRGRAYIDMGRDLEGGEKWLQMTGNGLAGLGFPVSYHRQKDFFDFDERFDAPAFYFGWWTHTPKGALAQRDFRFPPGAVGFHISSFSGQFLRNPNKRWAGALIDRGISATVGNVYEPYLGYTHIPVLYVQAISRGKTVGEAAAFSLRALSWQAIAIGDPLYRPNAVPYEQQARAMDRISVRPDAYTQYTALRGLNLLERHKNATEQQRVQIGQAIFPKAPGLALALEIARLRAAAGESIRFGLIEVALPRGNVSPARQGLVFETAQFLDAQGNTDLALEAMRRLLDETPLSSEARAIYLPYGIVLAAKTDARELQAKWEKDRGS